MANDKIGDQGGQRGPRNIRVLPAKSKPHTARRRRCIITGNLGEMGIDIVPRINKRSALAIRGMRRFFLIGMVRLGINDFFTYIACGGRIGDNLFSFMAGRALTFRWRHGAAVDQSKQMRVLEKENTVKRGKRRKCLCWKGRGCLCLECEGTFP